MIAVSSVRVPNNSRRSIPHKDYSEIVVVGMMIFHLEMERKEVSEYAV
jgi:hypothetical protein